MDDILQSRDQHLARLYQLAHEVDFAAFVFARDDWTAAGVPAAPATGSGQASPRDNVVFEAGLFGGVLGMQRTFILHASGSKLPSDLLGLTCVRYGEETNASEMKAINQKLRKAIEGEGSVARIEGLWWQFSLTARGPQEPSAVSLLRISRDRDGALEVRGRAWQEDGTLSSRYWSEAVKERKEPSGIFYYWNGERPLRSKRSAAVRNRRNKAGVRRSRRRLLGDSLRRRRGRKRADIRCLLARRSGGPEHPGRTRRQAARRIDHRAAGALEVDHKRLRFGSPRTIEAPQPAPHTLL